uniref:Core-2/I-Branching enzyme n=1 Tax=Meloidogyne hapla TaxID=6305 RepID=A0A1I8C0F1_MELHA
MLEQMLSVEYAPHNVYCYSLDRKADKKFKERIRALSLCFPTNVFVADVEYNVYSSGKNVSRSHLSCLEELNKRKEDWKYVVLLQNHDLPLRTNAELVRIFKAYNGTNDIATKHIIKTSVDKSLDWSLKEKAYPPNVKELYHTKSLNLITLTRAAVNFVLKELNVYPFIDQLEKSRYGMDEVLYSTLNSNLPDFPGGFTTECLKNQNKIVSSMGRYVIWRTHGKQTNRCMSDYLRHDVCVYGVEDLPHIARARLQFYLNKMMPSFDYGAIFCWLSTLTARRLSREIDINEKYYQQLPHKTFK